jgi:peptidylprolyl isomerase
MKVQNGHNVHVHYRGTLDDGTEFDNSKVRGNTLGFQVGSGKMIRGFDNALLGMSVGDSKKVALTPGDAYGDRDPDAFQTIPKLAFGEDFVFKLGETVQGNGPRGPFLAKIHDVRDSDVVLDFNHPLAGENLTFEIELVSIDGATTAAAAAPAATATAASAWNKSMKKAELLEVAKQQGLDVNTRTTKAQLISALESAA